MLDIAENRQIDNQRNQVSRRFINSAIYIEKPVSATISNTTVSSKYSKDDLLDIQTANTKRCTCAKDQKHCPFHCLQKPLHQELPKPQTVPTVKTSDTQTKILPLITTKLESKKDQSIKEWITKKEEERRKKETKQKKIEERKMKQREVLLEEERRNFNNWLMSKKKLESEAKKKKQKSLEEQQLKELEKEKRQLENELNFRLWQKRKEEAMLEKKIKQQLEVINQMEQKQKHMEESRKAFDDWLKNSRNKQKPVQMNKGIQSLCSTNSVTYVNPQPWNSP